MRKILFIEIVIIFIVIITGIGVIILVNNMLYTETSVQNRDISLNFNKDNAYTSIKNQTQDIGFRIPGTNESRECIQYFVSEFQTIDSNFTYLYHNFTIHNTSCCNVLFKMNEGYDNIVILGAHFDSRARATKDSDNRSAPVPGANDGASGCAVLLELARVLYPRRENLSAEIWFLFFDAEDQGYDNDYGIDGWDWCEGSNEFVNDIDLFYNSSQEDFDCMVLLDMVGGIHLRFINELFSTSSLLDELFATGRALGYNYPFPSTPTTNRVYDDHKPFVSAGIPSADLVINFWNNPNWPYHHTTKDNLTYISKESLEITGTTVEQFIYNNYYNVSGIFYRSNYPWSVDQEIFQIDLFSQVLFFTLAISLIGLGIIGFTWKSKKDELKN
ncbi:MAG: M28 family peptidase [Promethearchaeota archaeon]|nr:MAG: M28 family peptidase [Candidatus Lokiarchaeota archaeon]